MVLFNAPLGVFAWTIDEDESDPSFTKKFQSYLSEFLMTKEDLKRLRTQLTTNFKTKTEMMFIITNYIKLKKPDVFGALTDSLFDSWRSETMRQLDIYEGRFKTFIG